MTIFSQSQLYLNVLLCRTSHDSFCIFMSLMKAFINPCYEGNSNTVEWERILILCNEMRILSLENKRDPNCKTLSIPAATGLKHCPGELSPEFLILQGHNVFRHSDWLINKNRIWAITWPWQQKFFILYLAFRSLLSQRMRLQCLLQFQ